MATAQADFDEPKDQEFWARGWHCPRAWSHLELAMFRAIGKCVITGLLLDEVGQLLDATDTVLRPRMTRLHEAGHRTSVSTMFASVYAVQHPRAADALPAAYICGTIDTSRMWGKITDTETGYAARMWRPNPSWGQLHVAALLSRPLRHPEDAAGVLDLLRAGWRAGGYHLHLELLEAARFAHRALPAVDRDAVADFLDTLDVSYNIGLSSLLLEVLGLYERIEPIAALDEIHAEIAAVIADPSDHSQRAAAAALVSKQYEDERVFGPYGEAVMTLPLDQRLTLFAMAALSPGELLGFGYPDAVSELADNITRTDDLTGRAIAETARRLRTDAFSRQDAVAAHLHALRGWAKVCDKLPHPGPPDDDPAAELLVSIWRMIDNLLFPLLRGDQVPPATAHFLWEQLHERCAGPTAAILCDIRRVLVPGYNSDTTFSPHDLLVTAYPEQIRTLLEWVLIHRDQVAGWPEPNIAEYLIETLSKVGVESTAAMLRHYVPDTEIGPAAITAIKAIETRCEAPS
nr:hypothetical protein [Mycolicibacterium chubuense]